MATNPPSIVCTECGKTDRDVCDPDWTMGFKRGVITSTTCNECDGVLLFASMIPNAIVIIDEYEAPYWWAVRENMKR